MDEEQNKITQERLDRIEGDVEDIFNCLQDLLDGLRKLSAIAWPTCPPDCLTRYHERRTGERRRKASKTRSQKKGAGKRGSTK